MTLQTNSSQTSSQRLPRAVRWLKVLLLITLGFSGLVATFTGMLSFRPVFDLLDPDFKPATQLLVTPTVGKASGPLRRHPSNPRYFTDGSGRAILLAGSHTWFAMQSGDYTEPPANFNFDAYLDWLQARGHNFFKTFAWMQTGGDQATAKPWYNAPLPYQRTGPGAAADGKPKYDLTKFDQAYFDNLRQKVIKAGDRGIYVSVQFFYGFSFDEKNNWGLGDAWPYHPYKANNNINGINADPTNKGDGEDFATLNDGAITALQEAYIRKVIDTLNDLDNVIFEICNEPGGNVASKEWQYHFVDYVHAYEATKPKQHPVGMTVAWPSGNNDDLFNSNAAWISPNGNGGYDTDPPAADGSKVILSDTDHIWGVGGDRSWVWKSFTRGLNPTFMDPYDCASSHAQYNTGGNCNSALYENVRYNLGYVVNYASRMNLAALTPRPELASSTYCLANPVENGAEYLVYLPVGSTATAILQTVGVNRNPDLYLTPDSSVTVDLTGARGELKVEWFNPETAEILDGGTTTGGAQRSFTAPFTGDAVLYLVQQPATSTFKLYVPIIGQGSVNVEPSGPYSSGQQVALTANPAEGWQFGEWSGALTSLANPVQLTISKDITVTATFVPVAEPFYTITLAITGSGSVLLFPVGPFTAGQVVTLTAQPEPGWQFANWGGDIIDTKNPVTLTLTGNKTVTATFRSESGQPLHTVGLNIVGNGVVQIEPNQPFYKPGQPVTVTAVAADNWQFNQWSGALTGKDNPQTLVIAGGQVITATFMPVIASAFFSLTVNTIGQGTVAVHPTGPYQAAQAVRLTAIPEPGWNFVAWSGQQASNQNPLMIAISSTQVITAQFDTQQAFISIILNAKR